VIAVPTGEDDADVDVVANVIRLHPRHATSSTR
jgi:hypothetical protein